MSCTLLDNLLNLSSCGLRCWNGAQSSQHHLSAWSCGELGDLVYPSLSTKFEMPLNVGMTKTPHVSGLRLLRIAALFSKKWWCIPIECSKSILNRGSWIMHQIIEQRSPQCETYPHPCLRSGMTATKPSLSYKPLFQGESDVSLVEKRPRQMVGMGCTGCEKAKDR